VAVLQYSPRMRLPPAKRTRFASSLTCPYSHLTSLRLPTQTLLVQLHNLVWYSWLNGQLSISSNGVSSPA